MKTNTLMPELLDAIARRLTPPKDLEDMNRRVFIAGSRRRRPALMTNCTTLLSLIPVLWSEGRGAEVMRPMVLPIIGGMIFDLVSLFSIPVFYSWWWKYRLARQARQPAAQIPVLEPKPAI